MNYTFFWHGPFSQWYASNFIVNGVLYTHAEQFMMAEKARIFQDYISLDKIMKSKNPKEQKTLGRNIENFNQEVWNSICKSCVYNGNLSKFSQNDDLKSKLKATIGTLMVEASPYDKIWGIGLGLEDPKRFDETLWLGSNYLGQVLTAVRKTIFNHEEDKNFIFDW
jgi:ribA/ribD-fused uncharacterized protein